MFETNYCVPDIKAKKYDRQLRFTNSTINQLSFNKNLNVRVINKKMQVMGGSWTNLFRMRQSLSCELRLNRRRNFEKSHFTRCASQNLLTL